MSKVIVTCINFYGSCVTSNKRGREFSIINNFENKILIYNYNSVKLVVKLFMCLDNIRSQIFFII